jgi:methionine-rich copper-binding protein CopC
MARMTAGAPAHATVIAAEEPAEVAVGTEFIMTVRVSCPEGCDLAGVPIEVLTPDNAAVTVKPDLDDVTAGATHRVALKAPLHAGQHVWCVSCPAHESGGRRHGATQLQVPVRIRPHETSLAVWSIPSPVVTDRPFAIKVGVKSSASCDLTGMPIAVCDAAGAALASGVLGNMPWPGTSALYWTELTLTAPAEAGMFAWSVTFAARDLAPAHHGSTSRFSIAIVHPPEHRLTVKVVEQDTATPVENAQVRLGPYRVATDGFGIAELVLPKGSYDLNVLKSGYEAPTTAITIDADLAVDIAITPVPEENSDDLWQM